MVSWRLRGIRSREKKEELSIFMVDQLALLMMVGRGVINSHSHGQTEYLGMKQWCENLCDH